jgi:hypothetical protein
VNLQLSSINPVNGIAVVARHETQVDWHIGDTVHALYMASHRFMPQTLHTDSEAASDDDASDEQPALVDSDSDAS